MIAASRAWASGDRGASEEASELRRQMIEANHTRYFELIPLYHKVALDQGFGKKASFDAIGQHLMLDAGIFKSYEPDWLDAGDYAAMTEWLSSVFCHRINADLSGIDSIDGWIERLHRYQIHVVYSSGTSGEFSFIPRTRQNWQLARTANIASLAPQILDLLATGINSRLLRSLVKSKVPEAMMELLGKRGLPEYHAAFLGFRQGRMGNQALMEELAPFFSRCCFLYEVPVSGSGLRSLRRGSGTRREQELARHLHREVVERKNHNYMRLIEFTRNSTRQGRKLLLFGAPYQFKEMLETMCEQNVSVPLNRGSLVLVGGGWKTFTGETVRRQSLVEMLAGRLGLEDDKILEGYSMTEINTLMLRCRNGRFHIPPVIEPVLMDSGLNPVAAREGEGTFGFMDPLALDYPGFIVSSDQVLMVNSPCECGLTGPAVTRIGRLPGSEIKGCGGIMGSVGA